MGHRAHAYVFHCGLRFLGIARVISRRQLLKGLAGGVVISAAALVLVRETPQGYRQIATLHDAAHHDISKGFGLAVPKREGATIWYDTAYPNAQVCIATSPWRLRPTRGTSNTRQRRVRDGLSIIGHQL